MDLFTYGTLVNPGFVRMLLGHPVEMVDAELPNHIRLQPSYYMAFPHDGGMVRGKLLRGLSAADVAVFDRYEGQGSGYYDRQPVQVRIVGESQVTPTEAYLGGPKARFLYEAWRGGNGGGEESID